MVHYKISELLNNSTVSKFETKKWVQWNDSSSGHYSVKKNIRFKVSVWRSNLWDYSDAHIVVKETIDLLADDANENDKAEKDDAFKNNAQFRSCMSNTTNTLTDKRIFWNKYKSETTTQTRGHNLDYLINPTFRNINRLSVILFKRSYERFISKILRVTGRNQRF